jgi:alkylated DNA repair dioxygenase AlkB
MIIKTKDGGKIEFYENFLDNSLKYADAIFDYLKGFIPWKQEYFNFYGKKVPAPRLICLQGDINYSYSGLNQKPEPFLKEILELKEMIENTTNYKFNSCLLNYYRNGKDSISWHADDEKELGINPTIASLSFGATRKFLLKHNLDLEDPMEFDLNHNSLLIMSGTFQHNWKHSIPKEPNIKEPRINLTFRNIQGHL